MHGDNTFAMKVANWNQRSEPPQGHVLRESIHPHLMLHVAAFVKDRWLHLIDEKAACNLEQYMSSRCRSDISDDLIVRQLSGVAGAVYTLKSIGPFAPFRSVIPAVTDYTCPTLQPDNILCFPTQVFLFRTSGRLTRLSIRTPEFERWDKAGMNKNNPRVQYDMSYR